MTERVVVVCISGGRGPDRADDADQQRYVARLLGQRRSEVGDVVGDDAGRPGAQWNICEGWVKRMPEQLRAVHEVLQQPARTAHRPIEAAYRTMDDVGYRFQPCLASDPAIGQRFSHDPNLNRA